MPEIAKQDKINLILDELFDLVTLWAHSAITNNDFAAVILNRIFCSLKDIDEIRFMKAYHEGMKNARNSQAR